MQAPTSKLGPDIAKVSAGTSLLAQDHQFHLLIFCFQGPLWLPQSAHTFATFVHSVPHQDARRIIECKTISWLPASLSVSLLAGPEVGRNLTLEETLAHAKSINAPVYLWGPYRIDRALYDRASQQIERFTSGAVQYKAIDIGYRPDSAVNCFHAIADLDTEAGYLTTGIAYGKSATAMVAHHLSRWKIESDEDQSWLLEQLDLAKWDIQPGE